VDEVVSLTLFRQIFSKYSAPDLPDSATAVADASKPDAPR
jgi:hypothetical protein